MYLYQNIRTHIHVYIKDKKRAREREENQPFLIFLYIYIEKQEHRYRSNQIDLFIMYSSINDNRKLSIWNFITFEPLYVIIHNVFIVRPLRVLLNYYIKPAKFLVIVLPRNIWNKGNLIYTYIFVPVGRNCEKMSVTYVEESVVTIILNTSIK